MTVPASIPGTRLGSETGLPESSWVTMVRDKLHDWPEPVSNTWTADGVNGLFSAGATPVYLSKKPVYDSAGSISVGVGGVNYPLDTLNPPAAGKVFIDYNAALVYFASPPTVGAAVTVGYQWVRWTDQTILEALVAGMRELFPIIGKNYVDTSIRLQANKWDYLLPAWSADPRSRVLSVEVRDPDVLTQPYQPVYSWEINGDGTIMIPHSQRFSPVAGLRITGWGPYLFLGDMEPQLQRLPLWYAIGALIADRTAGDQRNDTLVPQAQEGRSPTLDQLNVGKHYMNLFEASLLRMQRAAGPKFRRRILSSYERRAFSNG
jgi:hypothetical protein